MEETNKERNVDAEIKITYAARAVNGVCSVAGNKKPGYLLANAFGPGPCRLLVSNLVALSDRLVQNRS